MSLPWLHACPGHQQPCYTDLIRTGLLTSRKNDSNYNVNIAFSQQSRVLRVRWTRKCSGTSVYVHWTWWSHKYVQLVIQRKEEMSKRANADEICDFLYAFLFNCFAFLYYVKIRMPGDFLPDWSAWSTSFSHWKRLVFLSQIKYKLFVDMNLDHIHACTDDVRPKKFSNQRLTMGRLLPTMRCLIDDENVRHIT